MVLNFPSKVSRNSGNCSISEMQTIWLEILEIQGANYYSVNGKKNL